MQTIYYVCMLNKYYDILYSTTGFIFLKILLLFL